MRLQYGVLAVLFLTGIAAGQPTNSTESPGIIGPGHPLYGAELAVEDTLVGTPIGPNPGELAQERASEAKIAIESGMNESFERANQSLNRVAQKATEEDSEGLTKATQILETIQTELPDEAANGLDTSMEQLSDAMNRSAVTGPENSGQPPVSDQHPSPEQ